MSTGLKPYPSYKDSGVPWLGRIPAHWNLSVLKHSASFFGGGTPSKDNPGYWAGDIPWVSPKDMKEETVNDSEDHITPDAIRASATRMIPSGSVLVVVRSGILKHTIPVAINSRPVALNQDMKAIVPKAGLDSGYVAWFMRGLQSTLLLEWRKAGATVESLEHDLIARTRIPRPEEAEQQAIASFLDQGTARIDGLVKKMERLIELLQEQRTALISHNVTQGLNPNAPKKDSGIAWLGHIPAHWQVKRLKFLTQQVTVGIVVTPSKFYVDVGVPSLRSLNVDVGRLVEDDLVFISDESNRLHRKSMIHRGDLVAVRSGQPGTTAVVDERFDGANCIDLIIIRKSDRFDSDFLCFLMNSDCVRRQFDAGSGGAIQQHFNIETAGNLQIIVPPVSDQRRIVEKLSEATARLDALMAKVRTAIKRLQEYRTALISAAVTGQIDVRPGR